MLITYRRIYDLLKYSVHCTNVLTMSTTKISDFAGFKKALDNSHRIVVLTGAGISADSGIPVFRGAGGLWRTYNATKLATLEAFQKNPSLVWEFYHYRRTVAFNAQPNKAHLALAKLEEACEDDYDRKFHIITQNVDGLHSKAGAKKVIELHGALNKVRCMNPDCNMVEVNNNDPICEALRNRGDPVDGSFPEIPIADLPQCNRCYTLVRPNIVWFGECLNPTVLNKTRKLVEECDLCLVIGTSLSVYPACELAPMAADAGKIVAEFNTNEEPSKSNFRFHFPGSAAISLPKAFGYDNL